MKTPLILTLALCATIGGVQTAAAAPTVSVTQTASALPEIWQKVPPAQRLQYVRAAEMDATRILAERIMGLSLDGETTVRELAAASDAIKGELSATLKGVKTSSGPTYHEDGRVEVVRAVKVSNLVRCVTSSTNKANDGTTYKNVVEELDALGNAAIPGSLGHQRVRAKRAAEMDVYRRLAERVAGVNITAETTVKDFALGSDTIKGQFSNLVKSAEITAISYGDDGTVQVTATVKLGPLVRTITKEKAASGEVIKVTETVEQTVIEEVGSGAPPVAGAGAAETAAPQSTSKEVDIIIEDIL